MVCKPSLVGVFFENLVWPTKIAMIWLFVQLGTKAEH